MQVVLSQQSSGIGCHLKSLDYCNGMKKEGRDRKGEGKRQEGGHR